MGISQCKLLTSWLVIIFTVSFVRPALAQTTLDDLLKRVEAVEQKNADLHQENTLLKAEIQAMKDKQARQDSQVNEVLAKTAAPVPNPSTPSSPIGNFIKSNLDIGLYGFVMTEGVYSDSAISSSISTNGNVIAYNAPRETLDKNQHSFNMSAQNSRLGLNIKTPEAENGAQVSGKFEMDFNNLNGGTYQPRIRLFYAQLDYPKWGVTAGQAWDFVAPINSNTLNQSNLWRSGNIGFRHPQAYITNKWGEILDGKVTTKVGIIDTDDPAQENSGTPVLGAYVSYDTKIAGKSTMIGIGGVYGTGSTSILTSKGQNNNSIYGTILGTTVKLSDMFSVKGKGYIGGKLTNFLAGPSVGITNSTTLAYSKPVKVVGGFLELNYKPIKKLEFNLGTGLDDVTNNDATIPNAADRAAIWSTNRNYYFNVKYNITKEMVLGMELQRYQTRWIDSVHGDETRLETAVIYNF